MLLIGRAAWLLSLVAVFLVVAGRDDVTVILDPSFANFFEDGFLCITFAVVDEEVAIERDMPYLECTSAF